MTKPDEATLVDHEAPHLRREGLTMALYVAVCLLAAMIAVPDKTEHAHALGIVWGISLGLVLAHLFAFQVSTRLVGSGRVSAADLRLAAAQIVGGAAAALLATVPVLLLPDAHEVVWVEAAMAVLIAGAGYDVARGGGASRLVALLYGVVVLLVALAIALVKNHLAGH